MCLHALLAMHDFRKIDKKRRYQDIHLISLVSLGTSLTWLYSGGVNIYFIVVVRERSEHVDCCRGNRRS